MNSSLAQLSARCIRQFVALFAFLTATETCIFAVDTPIKWNGGNGSWSTAGNWTPATSPNNSGGTTYAVTIDGATGVISNVQLNTDPTINALTVDAGDSLTIQNNHTLKVVNSITNSGSINIPDLADDTTHTKLKLLGSTVAFNGNGVVLMSDSTATDLEGLNAIGSFALINGPSHTIRGGGNLGNDSLQIDNQGIIEATGKIVGLRVDPNAAGLTNHGTIQATGGGVLHLQAGSYHGDGNSLHQIIAKDNSIVYLENMATFDGGIFFASEGTGKFIVPELTGSGVNLRNVITNNASIEMRAFPNNDTGSNNTFIHIANGAVLTGNGQIVMLDNPRVMITREGTGDAVFTNDTGHTIHGGGKLGDATIRIVNKGLIDATGTDYGLRIDPSVAPGVDGLLNQGTIQASGDGKLQFTSGIGATFTNEVDKVIQTLDRGSFTFSSGTLKNKGMLKIGVGTTATIAGNYTDESTATILSDGRLTITSSINSQGQFQDSATGTTIVNGSFALSSSSVVIHGKLGGTGAVNDAVEITSNAIIAPGESAGTLRTRNLTMDNNAIYAWDYSTTSTSDLVMVNNSSNLNFGTNATLRVGFTGFDIQPANLTTPVNKTLFDVEGTIGALPNWTIQLPQGWTVGTIQKSGSHLVVLSQLQVARSEVGDYNYDGTVDAADYAVWRDTLGTTNLAADGNKNGTIDAGDYNIWKAHFGGTYWTTITVPAASAAFQVPEPASSIVILVGIALLATARRNNSVRPDPNCRQSAA